jgi:hypothetical protein
MHHKHPGNIGPGPRNLELVFLHLWYQVVDGVPQLVMISAAVGRDRLPCSVSYCILASGPEGWSLVSAEHIGSVVDLHDCLILFSARARNSLDSKLWRSGDVDVVQQISQSASGDRGFISKSFDLVGVVERLVLLGIAPRSSLHHLLLQPCCPLLLPPRGFLPPHDRYRGRCSVAAMALLPVLLEVLVSQVPRPQSRMAPPPEESHAAAPAEAAHPLVLLVLWADIQCSSGLCDEYEPSKIWK